MDRDRKHLGAIIERAAKPIADRLDLSVEQVGKLPKQDLAALARSDDVEARLRSIEGLSLGGQSVPVEELKLWLAGTRCLRRLDLSQTGIGANDMLSLVSSKCTDRMAGLDDLLLRGNGLGSQGIEALSKLVGKLKGLRRLALEDNSITPKALLSLVLAECWKDLDTLWLGSNPLGDRGIAYLTQFSSRFPSLKHLEVPECGITDRGFLLLVESLQRRPWRGLTYLWMPGNPFKHVPEERLGYGDTEYWRMALYDLHLRRQWIRGLRARILGHARPPENKQSQKRDKSGDASTVARQHLVGLRNVIEQLLANGVARSESGVPSDAAFMAEGNESRENLLRRWQDLRPRQQLILNFVYRHESGGVTFTSMADGLEFPSSPGASLADDRTLSDKTIRALCGPLLNGPSKLLRREGPRGGLSLTPLGHAVLAIGREKK